MKIFLITDIHYGKNINYPKYGGEDYINTFGSTFESFLPAIQNHIKAHDLVINLGDLIHETESEGDVVEYKKALGLLNVGKPVKNVAGNHDLNAFSREQLAALWGESKLYYSLDLGGYHHVVLDGVRDMRSLPHYIDQAQIDWLTKDLEETTLPTIVFCHYPLDEQDVTSNYYFKDRPEKGFITNRKEIRALLEKTGKVILVFSGHLHFFSEMEINKIKYVTVPSFTENDGSHGPFAQCLSVEVNNGKNTFTLLKIN